MMKRLTEYHCGVAVIKNKELLSEAMTKLAAYEDVQEKQNKIRSDINAKLDAASEVEIRGIYYLITGYLR